MMSVRFAKTLTFNVLLYSISIYFTSLFCNTCQHNGGKMNTSSLLIIALSGTSVGLALYVRARVLEYLRLRRWLNDSTIQVLGSILEDKDFKDESLREVWFAIHKLAATKLQRRIVLYAFETSHVSYLLPVVRFYLAHCTLRRPSILKVFTSNI